MKIKFERLAARRKLEPKFPCLRQAKDSEAVVLFFSEEAGVVVKQGNKASSHHPSLGECIEGWVSCNDMSTWEEIPAGVVTITVDNT